MLNSAEHKIYNLGAWPFLSTLNCILQQEEMSEQQVRVGLVEKKLDTATKDSEEKVQAVQRKLEDAQNQLVKKEKYVTRHW